MAEEGVHFVLHNPTGRMRKVTVMQPKSFTVLDVKNALHKKGGMPLDEIVFVADGGARGDNEPLANFAQSSWVVLIHSPKQKQQSEEEEPAAGVGAAAEAKEAPVPPKPKETETQAGGGKKASLPKEASTAEGKQGASTAKSNEPNSREPATTPGGSETLILPFFYQGDLQNLKVPAANTVGYTLEHVIAPAFGIDQHQRLGIYMESCLLHRADLMADYTEMLRGAQVVPVVRDLVTTRVRDQMMPADAFLTDCATCMTTGVLCDPKPFCADCGMDFVVQVKPSISSIRQNKTQFPWRSLESLTGQCLNPQCKSAEKMVHVYFKIFCNHRLAGNRPCPSKKANKPLASYRGGRVEALLEELHNLQYFVRTVPESKQQGDGEGEDAGASLH